MNVLEVLKEEMAKSLKEFQENTNNWRESINTSKLSRKTQTKKWRKPINSINTAKNTQTKS